MSILKSEPQSNRLRRMGVTPSGAVGALAGGTRGAATAARQELRDRASTLGTTTRDAARSARGRTRNTATDRLVTARRLAGRSRRAPDRSRVLRVLAVALAAGAAVWLVRAVLTRSAAGEESAAGDAADGSRSPDGHREGAEAEQAQQRSTDRSRTAS